MTASPHPDRETELAALYDALRQGDDAGFDAVFTGLSDPPLLPILLAAVDRGAEAPAAMVAGLARQKMPAEEWQEAAARALEHAINGGQAHIIAMLLDHGAPASAKFAWVTAAKHGDVGILRQLAGKTPLQNMNLSSLRAKESFNAAVSAGKYDAAAWIIDYTTQVGSKDMQVAASSAMERRDEPTAMWLIRQIEARVPAANDSLRRIFNTLMNDAIDHEYLAGIDYLYPKAQSSHATALVHAAKGDRINSFNHIYGMAQAAVAVIEQVDRNTALMIAMDNGSMKVAAALLDIGADISVHNQGPLRKAVDNYLRDGFAPIRLMLERGADPDYARARAIEKFPADEDLPEQIAVVAHHLKAEAVRGFALVDFSPENLRVVHPRLGMTPLHCAAEKRLFAEVTEKAGPQLTIDDYLSRNAHGETLLGVLERQNQLKDVFLPRLWTGQCEKALTLLAHTSEKFREGLGVEKFLREVSQNTLQAGAKQQRYKLAR
ncbi:MAG TPA: hypothetical protein VEF76_12465 [Patescibacteria group bacterium]|nr:hypothetical protein [Patescibacteria group bacterium]